VIFAVAFTNISIVNVRLSFFDFNGKIYLNKKDTYITMENQYILKFYKRIMTDEKNLNEIKPSIFDFMAWAAFDGIDVFPKESFKNLNGSSLLTYENKDEEKKEYNKLFYFERQKLLILDLDNLKNDGISFGNACSKAILSRRDTNIYPNLPVITVAVLGFLEFKSIYSVSCDVQKIIGGYMDKNCNTHDTLKYRVFGTLLSNSVVLFLRGNSYYSIIDLLRHIRANSKNINTGDLVSTYSILGLDPHGENYTNWEEPKNRRVTAAIRFITNLNDNMKSDKNDIEDILNTSGALNAGENEIKTLMLAGRYDHAVAGVLSDCVKFAKLYIKSELHNKSLYCSSIFYFRDFQDDDLNCENCGNNHNNSKNNHNSNSDNIRFDKENELFNTEKIAFSPGLTDALKRLIIRIKQTMNSVHTNPLLEPHMGKITFFIEKALKLVFPVQQNTDKNETENKFKTAMHTRDYITEGVRIVNTLIDNTVIDPYYDFEQPDREPSCLGNASAMLTAYTHYAEMILGLFKDKADDKSGKKLNEYFHVFVMADARAKIDTINPCMDSEEEIIAIMIPAAVLYEVEDVLNFITHELGHKIIEKKYRIAGKNGEIIDNKDKILDELKKDLNDKKFKAFSKSLSDKIVKTVDREFTTDHEENKYKDGLLGKLYVDVSEIFCEIFPDLILYNLLKLEPEDYLIILIEASTYENKSLAQFRESEYWSRFILTCKLSGVKYDRIRKCVSWFQQYFNEINKKNKVNTKELKWIPESNSEASQPETKADEEPQYIDEAYNYLTDRYGIIINQITKNVKKILNEVNKKDSKEEFEKFGKFLKYYRERNNLKTTLFLIDGFESDLSNERDFQEIKNTDASKTQDTAPALHINRRDDLLDFAEKLYETCNYNDVIDEYYKPNYGRSDRNKIKNIKTLVSNSAITEHKDDLTRAIDNFVEQEEIYAERMEKSRAGGMSHTEYYRMCMDYLNAYNEVLKYIYLSNVSQEENMTAFFVRDLLSWGNKCDNVTIFSPHIVSAFFMYIENAKEYKNCREFQELSEESSLLKKIFTRIFLNNALLRFKRFNVYEKEAVELVKPGGFENPCECLPVSEISGIEDIRPVRLAEKIMMAFKEWRETHRGGEFKIGIIGNIRKNECDGEINWRLFELAQILNKSISDELNEEKDTNKHSINIDWYLLKKGFFGELPVIKPEKDGGIVTIRVLDDRIHKYAQAVDIIKNGIVKLDEFMDKYSLVFFLDCPNLYRAHEFVSQGSTNYYANYVEHYNFEDNYEKNRLRGNLFDAGHIFGLMSNICGQHINAKGIYGKFLYRVNFATINHIRERVAKYKSEEYKNIYIFLSSETAMANSDFDKRNIVREERYNGKSFDVVNLNNYDPKSESKKLKPVPSNSQKIPGGAIVLSLYQIIKNIDRKLIEQFELYGALFPGISDKPEDKPHNCDIIYRIRAVHVCFSYQSPERNGVFNTKIQYYIDSDKFGEYYINGEKFGEKDRKLIKNQTKIAGIIRDLTRTLFRKNIISDRYLSLMDEYRHNFYTALHSAVRSIDDMLYLHLLKNRFNFVLEDNGNPERIEENELNKKNIERYPKHYEDKRMYSVVMERCDQYEMDYFAKLRIKEIIRDMNESDIQEVTKNIREVCERYGYTKSGLHENITDIGGF